MRWGWVNFQCRGVLLNRIRVGQGPTALAVGANGGCLDIFLSSIIFLFFLPLSGLLYRLKYCLKLPLSPKQHRQTKQASKIVPTIDHDVITARTILKKWY